MIRNAGSGLLQDRLLFRGKDGGGGADGCQTLGSQHGVVVVLFYDDFLQINNLLGNVGNLVLKIDAVGNRAVPQIDGLQQRSDRICPSATSSSPTDITERIHEANHRHLVALSLLLQGLDVRHELVQTVRLQKVPKQRLYWSFRPPPPTVHESARNKVHHNIHIRLDFRRVQYGEQFCHEPIADLLHLVLVYRLRVLLTPT